VPLPISRERERGRAALIPKDRWNWPKEKIAKAFLRKKKGNNQQKF